MNVQHDFMVPMRYRGGPAGTSIVFGTLATEADR